MKLELHYFVRGTIQSAIGFLFVGVLLSCNINITDNPGPQVSTSIESAKKRHTFIDSYKLNTNTINKIPIESIFVEKKYFLPTGFLKSFDINCCESQMVIVFKEDNNTTSLNDIPLNWSIVGFDQPNSRIMVKSIKGTKWPDIVHIFMKPYVQDSITEDLTLYKSK